MPVTKFQLESKALETATDMVLPFLSHYSPGISSIQIFSIIGTRSAGISGILCCASTSPGNVAAPNLTKANFSFSSSLSLD